MRINVKSLVVAASFLLATLVGNGALWEYRKGQIEKQRIELEAEKRKIENMAEAIALRAKLTEVLYKLSDLAGEYHELLTAKKAGKETMGPYPLEHKRRLLDAEIDQLLSNYDAIEAHVARLEGREPRKLDVNRFKPPPALWSGPQNIRLVP